MAKVLIYVFLFLFSLLALGSGSDGVEPVLIFKSWKAGQGVEGGPSDAVKKPNVWYTFLTDTETTCALSVEVGYAANQPTNANMLNSFEWKVEAKILLPGLSESELKKHTFTFSPVTYQNGATGMTSTIFSFFGNGVLSEHWGPSGGQTARRKYCPNHSGTLTPEKGRQLKIDVKFIGYHGSDPNNQKKVEIELPLEQDQIDQMRQEYLDHRRLHRTHRSESDNTKYGDLSVPARNEFSSSDSYSDAHGYDYMVNKSLATKKKHWAQACDKYVGEILKKKHRITSLHHTGGYRNSHHHVYHVDSGASSSTKYWSYHQYGLALDVKTVDMDGDKILENNSTKGQGNWQDSKRMADAAEDYASSSWEKWNYSDGHVHAQWTGDSKSSERVTETPEEMQSEPSATLVPSDGIYTASAGDSHTAALSILSQGASIGFYVITPNDARNDVSTYLATASGDGTTSAASVDYTFPAHVSGNYTFYATIHYNDGTSHTPQPSYTVSVTASTPVETTPSTPTLSYSLVSSDGVYTAIAGTGHESNFSTSQPYSYVYWYVTPPGGTESGVNTEYGDGSKTTSQLGYSFPSGVSGDYLFKAYVYDGDNTTVYEASYTVSVSLPSSSTTSSSTTKKKPSATLGPMSGYSTTISPGDSFILEVKATTAFSSVSWYTLSPGNADESRINTQNFSPAVTRTTYFPYIDSYAGDYNVRVEITPVSGEPYSVSCTITVEEE